MRLENGSGFNYSIIQGVQVYGTAGLMANRVLDIEWIDIIKSSFIYSIRMVFVVYFSNKKGIKQGQTAL